MKYLLILGAKSDIALAVAHKFAKEGFNLYLACRNSKRLENDCNDLKIRYGIEAKNIEFDALKTETHSDFLNSLNPFPNVVVSAVGYLGDQKKGEIELKEAEKIISTNFTSLVSILNKIALKFEENKDGSIIGISSVAGDRGRKSNYLYGSAKAGFTAFLSGLRNRLNDKNVHVMTVKPGFVNTKMTENMDLPAKLTAEPKEVADAIYKGYKKKKNVIYTKSIWGLIMLIIKHIPEFIFKRMSL